uniref:Ig-like domain-containing protein n=1 Tax=Poecilia formosa TaxID=48698 RepID=A0A087XI61_POEFO
MLFLPAAALCWLGSALAAMATQLVQDDLSLTRRKGESVSFSCGGTDQCSGSYVYWYQKKENETFRAILRIKRSDGVVEKRYNHPQQDDFIAEQIQNGCSLKIINVTDIHSASYYCSCAVRGTTVRNDSFSLNKNLQ